MVKFNAPTGAVTNPLDLKFSVVSALTTIGQLESGMAVVPATFENTTAGGIMLWI